MSAYESLEQHFGRIWNLQHAKAIVEWDEATMMPMGGGAARAEAKATLDVVVHEMVTDPLVLEWIGQAGQETLDAWHEKMTQYLGLSTKDNFKDGCLQDVHWPSGLIGYFPTYTLGAMTAAQLFRTARNTIPDLMDRIGKGDFAPLLGWLRRHVHEKGKKESFDEMLESATGSRLDVNFFIEHLKERYLHDV